MNFQATLMLSNVAFLLGYLGVKLWDLRSGRDHVWEYTFAAERRRRGLPKLNAARPTLEPGEEQEWQQMAYYTELAWLVLSFAPAWMWLHPGPSSQREFIVDHAPVIVLFGSYMLLLRIVRSFWRRKFARK